MGACLPVTVGLPRLVTKEKSTNHTLVDSSPGYLQ